MRYSLAISIGVHAAILLAAIIALPAPDNFKVEELDSIPVDVVSIEELSQRKAMVKAEEKKPIEKPAAVKPLVEEKKPEPKPAEEVKKAAVEPEPEPEPAKPVEKQPDPKPLEDLIKETEKAKPKAEEKKTAEAPEVKPKLKPDKPKKKAKKELDIDKVAALLNKIEDEPASPPKLEELMGEPEQGDLNLASGEDMRISANEIDWLRHKIRECWNPPVGVMEAQGLQVHVQIELDQSGAVLGQPAVVNSSAHPLFGVAASSAVRAVLRCQPYDRLPIEKYEAWRSIILNFDPVEMFSG
jgi:outer membrane biosynthesis protein TonB